MIYLYQIGDQLLWLNITLNPSFSKSSGEMFNEFNWCHVTWRVWWYQHFSIAMVLNFRRKATYLEAAPQLKLNEVVSSFSAHLFRRLNARAISVYQRIWNLIYNTNMSPVNYDIRMRCKNWFRLYQKVHHLFSIFNTPSHHQ